MTSHIFRARSGRRRLVAAVAAATLLSMGSTASAQMTDGAPERVAQAAANTVTVAGQVTDGTGHGWPVYAKLTVIGGRTSTFTDPFTGEYRVSLPADATYILAVEPQYPGYAESFAFVTAGGDDITQDFSLDAASCAATPGHRGGVAVVTSAGRHELTNYLAGFGIAPTAIPAEQIDVLIDQVSGYDLVLYGTNSIARGRPAPEQFESFLAATDAAGVGVVFLDSFTDTHTGIRTLSELTGNPATRSRQARFGGGQQGFYEVVADHPVVAGLKVGQQFPHEPDSSQVAWFDGYKGGGRQVIGHVGFTEDADDPEQIMGAGIGVQERASNRHVLLSMHAGPVVTGGPEQWSPESEQVFWNTLEWVAPAASPPYECASVSGGLVLGHVTDAASGEPLNGAAVTTVDNPRGDYRASFATPEDPVLEDGFYWLVASLTGSQQITASAPGFAPVTKTVDVAPGGIAQVDFALPRQ